MDKGIFYLVCSVVIVVAVALSGFATVQSVKNQCVGKVVTQKVEVMVTPEPTATPSAVPVRVLRPTVKAPVK